MKTAQRQDLEKIKKTIQRIEAANDYPRFVLILEFWQIGKKYIRGAISILLILLVYKAARYNSADQIAVTMIYTLVVTLVVEIILRVWAYLIQPKNQRKLADQGKRLLEISSNLRHFGQTNKIAKHELKLNTQYFDDVEEDIKSFEIRKNDRNFRVGDILSFVRYDEDGYAKKRNDGVVTHVSSSEEADHLDRVIVYLSDYEQKADYVVLGISRVAPIRYFQ
jgi:hypothetical protein